MASAQANTIEFRLGQIEIRCSGEPEWVGKSALEVLRSIHEFAPRNFQPAGAAKAEPIAELLARARTETFGEQAGVVAYWLQEYGGRAKWRSGEIVSELQKLGHKVPTNITDALNHKLRRGYFATKDRMWELTPAGRSWVLYDLLGETEDAEVNTFDPAADRVEDSPVRPRI